MIQGVEDGWVEKPQIQVDGGISKDACSVESRKNSNGKSWHVGAVQNVVPYEYRRKVNSFEALRMNMRRLLASHHWSLVRMENRIF
eukprot:4335696-Karenia_brevis.AAC.1